MITNNKYNYPIEKMMQMLSFFEAYKVNRDRWNNNQDRIERHWSEHFSNSNEIVKVDLPLLPDLTLKLSWYIKKSLESGIEAHVGVDLARAIRDAFNNRYEKALTQSKLLPDFRGTDPIFSNTQDQTIKDIAKAYNLTVEECIFALGAALAGSDVIQKRTIAWNNAFNNKALPPHPQISEYEKNQLKVLGEKLCPKIPKSSSLFLFDLSGSMNEPGASGSPKIEEAKMAAKATLQNIVQGINKGIAQDVAIRGFSGDCLADPTYPITNNFTTDLTAIERAINSIPFPNGGTPLAEAIDACKQRLQQHLNDTGAKQAKLIILSDGQATCTPIRPNGVFATGQVTITVPAQQNIVNTAPIKYYAVGFNIAPGSPAERDLQYLAQISGGKYLNAQNQFELTRAFQKFNRVYIPKSAPSLANLPNTATDIFSKGLAFIENEIYPDALERYQEFVTQQPADCNGAFNFALMCEANDLYKTATKYYEIYLSFCPDAADKNEVMRQIENVKKDYEIYIQFNRNVIMSDMAYLDYHFKKVQNGESVALAAEFIGFIKEKWLYYKNLPEILEMDTRSFKSRAQDISRGLQNCIETIKRNPQAWDRDATPVISMTYLNLEKLIEIF